MRDIDDPASVFSVLSAQELKDLMDVDVIRGGMIPKAECVLTALGQGVQSVHIIDGRQPHSMLLEIFSDVGVGTMVTNDS
jgi:acetylglutamate kinase